MHKLICFFLFCALLAVSFVPCGVLEAQAIDDVKGLMNECEAYNDNGQYEKVLVVSSELFTRIQSGENPSSADSARAYCIRGIAYAGLKKYNQAIGDFNQAIMMNPRYAKAYNCLGNVYYNKGELGNALAQYNRAIALDANLANAYLNRGLIYYERGNYDEAIMNFNKVLGLSPKYADGYFYRGRAYYYKAETVVEREHTSSSYGYHNSKESVALNVLGLLLKGKGAKRTCYDRAFADLNKALELDPRHASAYNARGYFRTLQGNFAEGMADYDRALEINDQYAVAYYNRGNLNYQRGRKDKAVEDFAAALRINPQYEEAARALQKASTELNMEQSLSGN